MREDERFGYDPKYNIRNEITNLYFINPTGQKVLPSFPHEKGDK